MPAREPVGHEQVVEMCRNTKAQRHSDEGSLSEMRECEMCKAVYKPTSSNLTRYSGYMGCIYSADESVAEDESRRCDMARWRVNVAHGVR